MRRSRTIKVRLTPEEEADLKYRASRAGVTLSDLVRQAALEGRVVSADEIRRIAKEVNRIGVNLNQIARAVNASRPRTDCLKVYETLLSIQRDMRRLLEKVESGAAFRANADRYEGQAAVREEDHEEPIAV